MEKAQAQAGEDPRELAARKRARDMGKKPDDLPVANLMGFVSQILATEPGRALAISLSQDEAKAAFDVFNGFCSAQERYHRQVLGTTGFPQSPRLEVELTPCEDAEDEDTFDDRTEEERERDARNDWAHWEEVFQAAPIGTQSAVKAALYGWGGFIRHDDKGMRLTIRGQQFVEGITAMADYSRRVK